VITSRLLRGLVVLLSLTALPCSAQQWHVVSLGTKTGSTVSLDRDSASARKYIAKGWMRIDYPAPRERDGVRLTGYAAMWQVNCNNHTYWSSDSVGFRTDNLEPIRLYNLEQQWQSPAAGTDEFVAMESMCEETESLFSKVVDQAGEMFHQYVDGDK
jgi:hypothetical protein